MFVCPTKKTFLATNGPCYYNQVDKQLLFINKLINFIKEQSQKGLLYSFEKSINQILFC